MNKVINNFIILFISNYLYISNPIFILLDISPRQTTDTRHFATLTHQQEKIFFLITKLIASCHVVAL